MSKGVSTVWYEPRTLTPARDGLTAYFYARYENEEEQQTEELEAKPVEALSILEMIETFSPDPAREPDRLVGDLEREARLLVLDEQMGGLAPAESIYYGTISHTFLGYGPVGLDFELIDKDPRYFSLAETLETARESDSLSHMDERMFSPYVGHQSSKLFREARQKHQPDVYFDYRNGF